MTIRNWLKKFRADNFDLKDEDHNDRPAAMNMDQGYMLAENRRYSMREIHSQDKYIITWSEWDIDAKFP